MFLTLISPDLPIDILCQSPHMWEVEHHFVESSFLHLFPTPVRSTTSAQLSSIDAVYHLTAFFGFERSDIGRCVRVFAGDHRCVIVACCNEGAAIVCSKQGV